MSDFRGHDYGSNSGKQQGRDEEGERGLFGFGKKDQKPQGYTQGQKKQEEGMSLGSKIAVGVGGAIAVGAAAYGVKKLIDDDSEDEKKHQQSQHHQQGQQGQHHQQGQQGQHHQQGQQGQQQHQGGFVGNRPQDYGQNDFDHKSSSHGSATPHAYPLLPQNPGDPIIKIGSKVVLKHNMTGRLLRVSRQTGSSGQNLVIASAWNPQTDDDWQVIPANGEVIPPGVAVQYGAKIRLRHVNTKQHLHSHSGHNAPKSGQQEVCAFGGEMNSDDNDHWLVRRVGGGTGGEWNANEAFILVHKVTGKALHSHDILIAQDIQEVTAFGPGNEENDKWRIVF